MAVKLDSIIYKISPNVDAESLADLFRASGIRRPTEDLPRLKLMLQHANLIVGAYNCGALVGVARALTDFSYCCYVSDLAVSKDYQGRGIGTELLRTVKSQIGEQSMLLLLSSPEAMEYYPKAGLEVAANAFIIKRIK